jgi:hypothetical protein
VGSSVSSWLAPAAGLIGVLIGGLIAVLAARGQWRRESRREAYAQLLTAAHEVRWMLATEKDQNADSRPLSAEGPIAPFLAALDAANLLAAYRVQHVLNDWRLAAEGLLGSKDTETPMTLQRWSLYQDRFQLAAKAELHIRGQQNYSRLTAGLMAGASLFLFMAVSPLYVSPKTDPLTLGLGFTVFWAGLLCLIGGLVMAYRGRMRRLASALGLIAVDIFVVFSNGNADFYRPNSATWHAVGIGAILFLLGGRYLPSFLEPFGSLKWFWRTASEP